MSICFRNRAFATFILLLIAFVLCSCREEIQKCSSLSDEPSKAAHCLSEIWDDNFLEKPEVRSFLEKNRIYISYTTSPDRLQNSIFVLKGAQPFLKHVQAVYLTIPDVFKRTGQKYDFASPVFKFEKLRHLNSHGDYGPATKILPAVKLLYSEGIRDGVIVSIDDDIGYSPNLLARVIETVILKGGAASSQTNCIDAFALNPSHWPETSQCSRGNGATDMVEGWGAVAYRINIFDEPILNEIQALVEKSESCFKSDDLVINYVLAKKNIQRWNANANGSVVPFSYGKASDALHKGAGLKDAKIGGLGGNELKYQTCLKDLVES